MKTLKTCANCNRPHRARKSYGRIVWHRHDLRKWCPGSPGYRPRLPQARNVVLASEIGE